MFLEFGASHVEDALTFRRAAYCDLQSLSDSPQKKKIEQRGAPKSWKSFNIRRGSYALDKNHENPNDKSNNVLRSSVNMFCTEVFGIYIKRNYTYIRMRKYFN
jgi:hypothetical protein